MRDKKLFFGVCWAGFLYALRKFKGRPALNEGYGVVSSVKASALDGCMDDASSQAQAHEEIVAMKAAVPTCRLKVEMEADKQEVDSPGEKVAFRIRLKNKGQLPLEQITLEDSTHGLMFPFPAATSVPAILAPDAEWECSYLVPITGARGERFRSSVFVAARDPTGAVIMSQARVDVRIGSSK